MVKKYTCGFCGGGIEPGTGTIYVRSDGSLLYLCSSKCRKNAITLKRRPQKLKWTEVYEERIRRQAKAARARKRAKTLAKPEEKAKEKGEEKPKPKAEEKPKAAKPKAEEKPKPKTKAKPKAKENE